ncbi:tetratricopeptide repeat protein [Pseudanabaena sp. PCC 6802]|uniref:tetratricopeptide repeat protein n=1 Tax=Pseudanabaena sp. PCC 6802 TaxID=118173 RepID=UPI0003647260|nr:tetratricopeptide repeat protein [Pseudanabaena sp. PCC 6802]
MTSYPKFRRNSVSTLILIAGLAIARPVFAASPNSASQYRQQGLAYRQQERFPEAIAAFEKAAELAPKDVSARILLGWTQHLAGQESEAARSLWSAIYLDPFSVQAFNALGIVYLVQGELPPAITSHTWAALLKPDNEIAYYNLSLAYHRQKLHTVAIANAKRAAQLEPGNPHPLVAEAIAHWDNGDRNAAIQSFRSAVSIDSRYGDANFLDYLKEAGFSTEQIQTSKQVLLQGAGE